MTRGELLNRLAGPQPPDPVPFWPPGPAWWVLAIALALAAVISIRYRHRVPPLWRAPYCWRARRRYLRSLTQMANRDEPSVALSHWLRQLAQEGLGISPALPPGQWLRAVESALGESAGSGVRACLKAVYRPGDIRPALNDHHMALRSLCLRCLHLRSPGPRS